MLGVGVHLPLPSSLGAQPGQELDEAMPPPFPAPLGNSQMDVEG